MSEEGIGEETRSQAVEISVYAGNLLLQDYFFDAADAIASHNEAKFSRVCSKAGIPKKYHELIYRSLSAVPDTNKYW